MHMQHVVLDACGVMQLLNLTCMRTYERVLQPGGGGQRCVVEGYSAQPS